MVGGDERLVAAHRLAVREAFAELESLAAMQTGQGVMKRVVTTGNVCCAVFEHDTSRALDPQLHTHCVLANVTISESGTRYALETRNMVKAIRYAGKVYQSALRREVTRCGYRTRDKKNERGQIEGFEIVGVGDGILSLYSQRRAEIETAIEAWRKEHGREPSPAEIHVLAKETRSAKLLEISTRGGPVTAEESVELGGPGGTRAYQGRGEREFRNRRSCCCAARIDRPGPGAFSGAFSDFRRASAPGGSAEPGLRGGEFVDAESGR